MKSSVSVLILFLFSLPLLAQQAPLTTSAEIVVTASSQPEELGDTPASVTVVTRAEMEAREARDVAEVLREVAGLSIARTGSPGKSTSLFIRGGSSKQALVLWNGVEMNNPYFSGYNFGQLSTAGVEKVEVVRGPFSALYGSEAMSGVVNVLTAPSTSYAAADAEAGEKGLANLAFAGALTGDRWKFNGAVERREDDGFAPNDDFASTSILGGLTAALSDSVTLGLMARHNGYQLGIPTVPNMDLTEFIASPLRREEGSESQFVVPLTISTGRVSFDVRAAAAQRTEDFEDPAGPFGPEFSETDSSSRSIRATVRTAATALGSISLGGEYENAAVDHTSNFSTIDSRDRDNRSFFVEDRYSLATRSGSLEIAAGARHDHFDTFGSELSPRLSAAWIRNGHKFRAGYGEAFRAPAIGELYSPFFGNAALDPERSRSSELGYDRFTTGGSESITLFRSEYEGLIVFGSDFMFHNIDAARAQGVELAAQRRIGRLSLAGSYTWLDAEDEATGERLPRRPEHSGSLSFGVDVEPFTFQLVVAHQGARLDVTDLAPFGFVDNDAYTTADLAVHFHRGAVAPYVKVENVTNERYEEVFGYPSASRRVIAGVRWRTK